MLGRTHHIAHHFDEASLGDIMYFRTAERTHAFVRELQTTALMQAAELPPPLRGECTTVHRDVSLRNVTSSHIGLQALGLDLKNVIARQRQLLRRSRY